MCDRGQKVLSLKVTHTGISLVTSLSQSRHRGVRVKLGNGVSREESGFFGAVSASAAPRPRPRSSPLPPDADPWSLSSPLPPRC